MKPSFMRAAIQQLLRFGEASLFAILACGTVAMPAQSTDAAALVRPYVIDRTTTSESQQTPSSQDVIGRFERAYKRSGQPRIALFWNREFSDHFSTEARDVAEAGVRVSPDGRERSAYATKRTEVAIQQVRQTTLSESDLWQLETAVTRRLLDAGVKLIDRAVTMRLVAKANDAKRAEEQSVELSGLLGHAELFLEVLITPDDAAPLGWGFRSNLKEVKTGRILGSQYLAAMPQLPPSGPVTLRARPGGYDKVAPGPTRITVQQIGDTLALEAMQELAKRLASL